MYHKCILFVVPNSLSYIFIVVYTNKVALSDSFCQYTILTTGINKSCMAVQCGAASYTLEQNLVIPNPPTQNSPTNLKTLILWFFLEFL